MGAHAEIELKLEADPGALQALADAPALADVAFIEEAQHSTYFDTADGALRAAGLTLRVRRIGERRIQTMKAEGAASAGLFARLEWERELADDRPMLDGAAEPLAALPGLAAAQVIPVFTIDVRRRTGRLVRDDATVELVLDAGEIVAGGRSEPVAEAEIELEAGTPAALFALARELDAAVPLRLGVLSKSERGFALLARRGRNKAVKAEPGMLAGKMSTGDAFARIAAGCVRQFRRNEAILARTGRADALHQARVAIRRLRSALAMFRRVLADDRYDHFRGELRWLAATLGEVRDIDVLLAQSGDDLAEPLGQARARVYAEASAALASIRARMLMLDLAEWIAIGGWRTAADGAALRDRSARRFAAAALGRLRRRLKRRGAGLAELGDEERHEVRKLAKQLRYAGDFFAGLFVKHDAPLRAATFLAALEELQEQLGDLNDLVHGPAVLARLDIAAAPDPLLGERRARGIARAAEAQSHLIDAEPFWR